MDIKYKVHKGGTNSKQKPEMNATKNGTSSKSKNTLSKQL